MEAIQQRDTTAADQQISEAVHQVEPAAAADQ